MTDDDFEVDRDYAALPPLSAEFYQGDTVEVARRLLGTLLVRSSPDGLTAGRIVETEAYLAVDDSACHAARGRTRSNAAMFGPAGRAYVYPIHSRWCFNVVTGLPDEGTAVLVRAIVPLAGEDLMRRRRKREKRLELTRGPARLCEALAINRELDHWDLTLGEPLWIAAAEGPLPAEQLRVSPRIGVTSAADLPLRFFLAGNPFVSGKRSGNV
ncbi:DNA-3-methyladenine glycosylase [Lignipirellula cremea]|uniref:Putative 3-methyladenine DNA glycosylase n=1 Tax=Lignipirellula cremea TaxID=2528010 RepID=A0A518DMR1_9BACT|nr:DNA-3-methyladenine glycosylase [Lignipirellula cremea]QDU93112.1 3-methyladenine DNA glycosylase [Lignipirellula cremea]